MPRKSYRWNEEALVELELLVGVRRKKIIARLGYPRASLLRPEPACSFQLKGLDRSLVRVASGVDGLQALLIASDYICRRLDRARRVVSEVPYSFVFPRLIPISYGQDFHRHLLKMMDDEVRRMNRKLSRRRRSRELARKTRSNRSGKQKPD